MNKKIILSLTCGAFVAFGHSVSAELIYANGFENLPLGSVSDRDIKQDWATRYAKGPDEGRVEIVADAIHGNAARIKYPAFGNQSSPSGATWETDIQFEGEALYLSYWVKLEENFEFVKGGKLPGLSGSTSFPYGDNRFTTRLMWREEGKLEFYVHGYELPDANGSEPYRLFWDDFGEHARLVPGQWHHIEMYQRLNTPGQYDGLLLGWLDGVLVAEKTDDAGVRGEGHGATQLNHFYFSTFFGGSSAPETQWQPKNDVYAVFDEVVVSTERVGAEIYPATPVVTSPPHTDDNTDPVPEIQQCHANDGASTETAPRTTDTDNHTAEATSAIDSTSTTGDTAVDTSTDNNSDDTDIPADPALAQCQTITWGVKQEIDLRQGQCLQFSQPLHAKTVAVWDSDLHSCNFRGVLLDTNGTSLVVPDNYEASSAFTDNTLQVSNQSTNDCPYLVIRAS